MQRILRGQTRSTGVPEMPAEIRGWPASLGLPIGTGIQSQETCPLPLQLLFQVLPLAGPGGSSQRHSSAQSPGVVTERCD